MKFAAAVVLCLGLAAVGHAAQPALRLPLPAAIRATHPWLDTEPIGDTEDAAFRSGRVVGGSAAASGEAPYQIAMLRSGSFICGGSLIANNVVLTAAHCVFGYESSPSSFTVRYGTLDRTSGPTIVVSKVNRHASYSSSTIDYDIATFILSSAFTPSANAAVVQLTSAEPADGAALLLTGWGRLSSGGTLPTALQKATTLTVLNRSTCQSRWGSTNTITQRMLCAFSSSQSACNGDSGGPLVSGGVLVGVVSWGSSSCLHATLPNVYANVANLLSWIAANSS